VISDEGLLAVEPPDDELPDDELPDDELLDDELPDEAPLCEESFDPDVASSPPQAAAIVSVSMQTRINAMAFFILTVSSINLLSFAILE